MRLYDPERVYRTVGSLSAALGLDRLAAAVEPPVRGHSLGVKRLGLGRWAYDGIAVWGDGLIEFKGTALTRRGAWRKGRKVAQLFWLEGMSAEQVGP